MTSRRKRFAYGTLVDFIGMPITMLVGMLVIPQYFKFIDSDLYGYWIALFELITFLSLLNAGCDLYIIQVVTSESINGLEITKNKLSSLIFIRFALGIVVLFLAFILYYILPELNLNPNNHKGGTLLYKSLILWLISSIIFQNLNSIIVGQNRIALSGFFIILRNISQHLLPLLFLSFDFGLISFGISFLITSILYLIVLTPFSISYFNKRLYLKSINKSDLKEAFLFVIKNIFGRVSFTIFNYTDSIIIAKFLSTAHITIFVMTMKLTFVLKFLSGKLISNGFPVLSQLMAEKQFGKLREIILKFYRIGVRGGLFFFAIILVLNGIFVKNWVGLDKFGGNIITLFAAIIVFRESMFPIFNSIIITTKDITGINFVLFIEASLNIIFSIILVQIWGLEGVVLATILSTSFLSVSYSIYKTSKLTGLKPFELVKSFQKVFIKSIPSIFVIIIGYYLLKINFHWFFFFLVIGTGGIVNILFFEGKYIYKFRNLSLKELANKIIENS